MPAYSGGNRWVGVLALAPLPVPPPLHQMARMRIEDRTRNQSLIRLEGETIPVDVAHRALSMLSLALGAHGDLPRVTQSLALARSIGHGKGQPESWPKWAQNAVLRYASEPGYFSGSRVYDLKAWGLAFRMAESGRRDRGRSGSSPERKSTTPAVSSSRTTGTRVTRPAIDIVAVNIPEIVDPGRALDDVPVSPDVIKALSGAGWKTVDTLQERWLRLALMHSSYLYERGGDIPVNAFVLRMLGTLGTYWCHLYALEEIRERDPLASAGEQSRAWAEYVGLVVEYLAVRLHVAEAMMLGRGEALTSGQPGRGAGARTAVTWQVLGVLSLLGGFEAVARLAREAYAAAIAQHAPAIDWVQVLSTRLGSALTWTYEQSGPDHQTVFTAVARDNRGRAGTGSATAKSRARSAAAESFIRRYLPDAVPQKTRGRRPAVAATRYSNAGARHEDAIAYLRRLFELPPAAAPLLTQALTHPSWVYEHQALAASANQRDYTALAHLGAAVADALIAYEQVTRVASSTLMPTEDEARVMAPAQGRLWDLFSDLQLESGLLVGPIPNDRALQSIGAGSMQALLGVAWKYQAERLLVRRPRPVHEWSKIPNGILDPSSTLQQMCSEFNISYSIEHMTRGPDHDRKFTCLIHFQDGPRVIVVRGPEGANKTEAKHLASAKALAAVDGTAGHQNRQLANFLLRKQITHCGSADPHRSLLRGWLGVAYITSADIPGFEKWAKDVEILTGPLDEEDLARIRAYYERCILLTRLDTLPRLRSTLSECAEWVRNVKAAIDVRSDSRWLSFRAVVTTLHVITREVGGSLRGTISDWYGSAIGSINVDLSSESLDDDQDDLTATQAAALRAMLDSATETIPQNGRLRIAVYRQDNSVYVTITSPSVDLHPPLNALVRLLDDSVSYFTCVEIEHGWLVEARYVSPVKPTRLSDLGRALEAKSDQRKDLVPLARRAADLVNLIDAARGTDDPNSDHQVQASELLQRKGRI